MAQPLRNPTMAIAASAIRFILYMEPPEIIYQLSRFDR
jgi:hypothetical protein